MPISANTINAIQAAGASVFEADAALKSAVKEFAAQVHANMLQNPFDVGNDTLFEEWKTVARLSQAMGQIESEMQKIYAAASNVGRGGALKTSKPTAIAGSMVAVIHALEATDVVAKSVRKKMTSRSRKSDPGQTLSGNAAKVFEHLVSILDPSAFTKINQSAVAVAVGLPNGSIGASMVKLLKSGYLAKGPNGDFKIQAVH